MPSAFTNVDDGVGVFSGFELDEGSDFSPTGDEGGIIVVASGFGDGGFGDGPFGGSEEVIVVNGAATSWTNIETP